MYNARDKSENLKFKIGYYDPRHDGRDASYEASEIDRFVSALEKAGFPSGKIVTSISRNLDKQGHNTVITIDTGDTPLSIVKLNEDGSLRELKCADDLLVRNVSQDKTAIHNTAVDVLNGHAQQNPGLASYKAHEKEEVAQRKQSNKLEGMSWRIRILFERTYPEPIVTRPFDVQDNEEVGRASAGDSTKNNYLIQFFRPKYMQPLQAASPATMFIGAALFTGGFYLNLGKLLTVTPAVHIAGLSLMLAGGVLIGLGIALLALYGIYKFHIESLLEHHDSTCQHKFDA